MDTTSVLNSRSKKIGFDPDYLPEFLNKVFIEGANIRRRVTNFYVMLLLATVIATYGVLSDSTATVIGAMIVAPLMGPIMATTVAVVMGQAGRIWRSLLLVISGVAAVILFSYLLTIVVPDLTISFATNGELASRIQPGLYALLTALGAGAAGAYIYARSEIADSMGGVAIAISLVPPLCVVGIALSQGNWYSAAGALLLFVTNFVAIMLAGGITFFILGLGTLAQKQEETRLQRRSFVLVVLGTLLVAIPLSLTAYRSFEDTLEGNEAATITKAWLDGTHYLISSIDVNDNIVTVTVEGDGELNSVDDLADQLRVALNRPVIIKLRIVTAILKGSGVDLAP